MLVRGLAFVIVTVGLFGCGSSKPRAVAEVSTPTGCTDGEAPLARGLAARRGDGVARDYEAAAAAFAAACECGAARACFELGGAHSNAQGVDYSAPAALAALERGCEGGYGPACAARGRAQFSGYLELEADEKAAATWFARALPELRAECAEDDAAACFDLGYLALYGFADQAEAERVPELFEGACIKGVDDACVMFARVVNNRLEQRIVKACGDVPLSKCLPTLDAEQPEIGAISRGERARRTAALSAGCARGHYRSCYEEGGEEVARAAHLADCDAGHYLACFELAELAREDDPLRHDWLETSCRAKIGQACAELGDAARDGVGTAADEAAARVHYRRACDAGWKPSCAALSDPDLGGGCPSLQAVDVNLLLGPLPAPAAALRATTTGGKVFDLAAARGRTVLVYAGASWNVSSTDDLGELSALVRALGEPALDVVVLWSDDRIDPSLAPKDPNVHLILDRPGPSVDEAIGPLSRAFGVDKLAEVFVVDADGNVSLYVQGNRDWAGVNAVKCLRQLR